MGGDANKPLGRAVETTCVPKVYPENSLSGIYHFEDVRASGSIQDDFAFVQERQCSGCSEVRPCLVMDGSEGRFWRLGLCKECVDELFTRRRGDYE